MWHRLEGQRDLGSTRVHVVIKAKDPNLPVKVKVSAELWDAPSVVTYCMDVKMCLTAIELTEEGSKLRNDNEKQLQCLSLPIGQGSVPCVKWKNCLSLYPTDMAMLKAILKAAVGSPSLVEHQPTLGTEPTPERTGTCAHPKNDDALSWECECGAALQVACAARVTDLDVCIKEQMCASAQVCCSWKQERSCPDCLSCTTLGDCSSLIQATPTLAETLEGRRQPRWSNRSTEPLALLDGSVTGKACTKQNR